ncbi:MAG TPA: protein kinase, partial [Steroidobacteraceae bacterium]|nr:protein kinase [Steroidobacteraceae bacterium]
MHKYQIDVGSWEVLNRLLDKALELPPPQVDTWLETLAPEFDALKPQLKRMLSRYAQVETGDFLNTLPKFDIPPAEVGARTEQPGDVIGPYRLERELGSGGMGVVWLAVRTDVLVKRPVALKLPHGAWRRAGLAERMAREREILATLTHPNIAHLYDAGVTAEGQPYLAIEYVEGTRVDVYCRERQLTVRARLELFAQAAKAVAYAHGKLVVHRDLKPANILVTADGQVRLLDFGIAKLLEDGQARETRFTEISGRALTPDYASPEQILGEPLTIASDVYSLGVILYELLCDQRPYKLQRDSRGALEEAILQADPPLPSDVADARQRPALRGDLDTVVLKALRKKPAERYPTVHALLDDIERHLGSRPVLAQRDSRWYRARKFIMRNRLAVGAAGAIVLALIIGTVVATWQARVALAEKARAEEVQEFITSVFRDADPWMQSEGKALSATQLLLQAEKRLNQRSDATPTLKVAMLVIIGESLFSLQENKESARVATEALSIQQRIPDADPLVTARLHLALSKSQEYLGDNDAAVAELGKTFAALETARDAGPVKVRARLHESALGMAVNDYSITERAARQAIDEASAVMGPRSDEVAMALMFLSKAYIFTERMPEAVEPARQGLDMLLANHNGDYAHPQLIDLAPYYANALIHVGDFEAAAVLMRTLISHAERVFGADSNLVGGLANLAVPAEMERGELDAAISLARRSVDNYLKEAQPATDVHAYRARLFAQTLTAARFEQALRASEEAVQLSGKANAPRAGRGNLGLALIQAGRLDEADEQLRIALEGAKPGTRGHMQGTRHRGTVLRLKQQHAEALPWLEKAVAESGTRRFDRGDLAPSLVELGLTQLELGDVAAAQKSFAQAKSVLDELQGQRLTPTRVDLLIGMARVSMQGDQFAAALPHLQRAEAYWRERRPDSRWAGEAALWLGRCHLALGQRAEARAALDRADKLLSASRIPADI